MNEEQLLNLEDWANACPYACTYYLDEEDNFKIIVPKQEND